jgi:hypothetical protein
MSMAATKISQIFIIFTALLLNKIAGYNANETRTTTGRFARPELTSDLNYFLSKGPMKSGYPPTETDQATWKKRTSKETAAAQQPRDQDLHHSRHFFRPRLHITPASMGLLSTRSKRPREQAGGSRTLRFTLTKQDKFSIPAQERKSGQMKFYLTSQEQHIYYHTQ